MLLHVHCVLSPESAVARVTTALEDANVVVKSGSARGDWMAELRATTADLVLIDRDLLAADARKRIEEIRGLPDRPEIVVFAPRPDERETAHLLSHGCLAVLSTGLDEEVLHESLRAIVARRREEAIARLYSEKPEEHFSLDDFISDSAAMQEFLRVARRVVRADTAVLLLGETGVGKGRLARAIHAEGPRASGPFVGVSCAALPESLLESELFGHEAGAFTGATRARKGYFETAHRGTLFLDEIGEVPPHVQVKLLRALEQRRVQRVGGEKPTAVDVRVIAATNRDLEAEMGAGDFRPDLFYRLAVVTLTIPPLRERREDIRKLALAYLELFRQQVGRHDILIEPDALDVLVRYDWPGNVRELINAVERAVLLGSGDRIGIEDLPRRIVTATVSESAAPLERGTDGGMSLPDALLDRPLPEARAEISASFERTYVTRLLRSTRGKIGETARRAGIHQRHLYELMKRHGLRKEDFKG